MLSERGQAALPPTTVMKHWDERVKSMGDKPALHQKVLKDVRTVVVSCCCLLSCTELLSCLLRPCSSAERGGGGESLVTFAFIVEDTVSASSVSTIIRGSHLHGSRLSFFSSLSRDKASRTRNGPRGPGRSTERKWTISERPFSRLVATSLIPSTLSVSTPRNGSLPILEPLLRDASPLVFTPPTIRKPAST